MDTIYIERSVLSHPRALRICNRFPDARHITIERHSDLFNARSQDFRQQKKNPSLILAYKAGKRVHATPPGYHIGGQHNYYFSHMLNCIYDCRYCFLQGMYQSANHVVFVNSEDFMTDIRSTAGQHSADSWYFSGYDCDSLALDPVTQFVDDCLDHFSELPNAWLELRTKSTQIRPLLKRAALPNVVVAYSVSPQPIIAAEEHGTPSLAKRLDALGRLQAHGWKIGLRFDPLLHADNFNDLYGEMFDTVFRQLDMSAVHSVSLGVFRLPRGFHKRLVRLYPDARLLAAPIEQRGAMMSYPEATTDAMRSFCLARLKTAIRPEQLFPCS
ncbi:MAG: DNA photolyase [Granulosicoccus sp.]|nr:DNA photolyase [Granulosicoccus sp.]